MKKTPSLIAATLLAITAGTALAQSKAAAPEAPPAPSHGKLDANNNGVIERSEAAASPRLAERFDRLDANGDGKLERSEMGGRHRGDRGGYERRGPGGPHGAGFAHADKDGDGRTSKAEATAAAVERFERMDVNKDGFVDRADREQAAQQHRQARFKALDGNGDGTVSQAEFEAAQARGDGPRGGPGQAPAAQPGAATR